MLPSLVKNLIREFSKLPGVGPRQAARFVFYLIKQPKAELAKFAQLLAGLNASLKKCSSCFGLIESSHSCQICTDKKRDQAIICLVEKDTDIEMMEKTRVYHGLYHVLRESKDLHLKELAKRIKDNQEIKEVIIATGATTTGDTLALYISKFLKSLKLPAKRDQIKITRLGRGLSAGSEIEYIDEETLNQALLGRK